MQTAWPPCNGSLPVGSDGTSPYVLQRSRHPSLQLWGPGLWGSSPWIFQPFAAHSISHYTCVVVVWGLTHKRVGWDHEPDWRVGGPFLWHAQEVGNVGWVPTPSNALDKPRAPDSSPYPPFPRSGCWERIEDALTFFNSGFESDSTKLFPSISHNKLIPIQGHFDPKWVDALF
jgi:hypothetical protein